MKSILAYWEEHITEDVMQKLKSIENGVKIIVEEIERLELDI